MPRILDNVQTLQSALNSSSRLSIREVYLMWTWYADVYRVYSIDIDRDFR